jgi:hypothetical protein
LIEVSLTVSKGRDESRETAAAITIRRRSGDRDYQYLRLTELELQELAADLLVLATDAAFVACLRRVFEKRKEAEENDELARELLSM